MRTRGGPHHGSSLIHPLFDEWGDNIGSMVLAELSSTERAMFARTSHLNQAAVARAAAPEGDWIHALPVAGQSLALPLLVTSVVNFITDLQWARIHAIAGGSHVNVAKYAVANGCPLYAKSARSAAITGRHVGMTRWLFAPNVPKGRWGLTGLLHCAAPDGHLGIVRWMRDTKQCPWDILTCVCATGSGSLEVLEWLHTKGCPWNLGNVATPQLWAGTWTCCGLAVGAGSRVLPVGRVDLCTRRCGAAPAGAAVGAGAPCP